jgi:hypothetical protein
MAWKHAGAPQKAKERKTEGRNKGRKVGIDMKRDSWESDVEISIHIA